MQKIFHKQLLDWNLMNESQFDLKGFSDEDIDISCLDFFFECLIDGLLDATNKSVILSDVVIDWFVNITS